MTQAELLAEARKLYLQQRRERGVARAKTIEGKNCWLIEPYVATPEREARASRIISLRRRAARMP